MDILPLVAFAGLFAGGPFAMKLLDAICYGFKRYLEPYFIAHSERVKSKTELEEFRKNPLRQLEFAQEFMKNTGVDQHL